MKLRKNSLHYAIDFLCLIMLLGTCAFLLFNWAALPGEVPMHTSLSGEIDRWGPRGEMLFLPAIAIALYLLLTIAQRYPQSWNTGVPVTSENYDRIYPALSGLLCSMKLILICFFVYLTFNTAYLRPMPAAVTGIFFGLLLVDIIFWIVKIIRIK